MDMKPSNQTPQVTPKVTEFTLIETSTTEKQEIVKELV